jgi:hypothetical protein
MPSRPEARPLSRMEHPERIGSADIGRGASDLAELKPAPAGLAPALLAELIRRVVEAAKPDRIIRFGSAAGSERGPDSDLDLLVIKSGVEHLRRLAEAIYLNLSGIESR